MTLVSFVVYDWPKYCILHGFCQLLCCMNNCSWELHVFSVGNIYHVLCAMSWSSFLFNLHPFAHSNYLISFAHSICIQKQLSTLQTRHEHTPCFHLLSQVHSLLKHTTIYISSLQQILPQTPIQLLQYNQ